MATDIDAIAYLQLATELCKELKPGCVLIAEDMSGLPGMCLPVEDGGVGFDYRLGRGLPDCYIKMLKESSDEQWHMGHLWHELNTRRPQEKVIGYCESHDQALVGDKTIMFWLADKEMYWYMRKDSGSLIIDRAMSLHKMFRLITCVAGGDGYLNFMGNEFGHPEWVDFPREGNGWSYFYCRRQWSLVHDESLRYHYLNDFDVEMIKLAKEVIGGQNYVEEIHEDDKVIRFTQGGYLFLFNFHPNNTRIFHLPDARSYDVVLHTNSTQFGGFVYAGNLDCILSDNGVAVDRRCAAVLRRK
jgi:1,4-alpha-glucan branching enzyme